MKKLALVFFLALTASAVAQGVAASSQQNASLPPAVAPTNIVEKGQAPSYSDVYCSGMLSATDIQNSNYIIGGADSPNSARFTKNDLIFLSGSGWQEGQRVSLVRRVKDPNLFHMYKGQDKELKSVGELFFDLGQATVTYIQNNVAVAHVDFSCEAMVPGDLVIPFQERAIPSFHPRPYTFPQFQPPKNTAHGRIILGKDFDVYFGEGKKFFINIGSSQGLKVGDYLRVTRAYDLDDFDPSDRASLYSTIYEDDQKNEPPLDAKRLREVPPRGLGEAIILLTTPTTATAMVTFSIEDVHIGDRVELEPAADRESGGN